jgi:hypothetical protein
VYIHTVTAAGTATAMTLAATWCTIFCAASSTSTSHILVIDNWLIDSLLTAGRFKMGLLHFAINAEAAIHF